MSGQSAGRGLYTEIPFGFRNDRLRAIAIAVSFQRRCRLAWPPAEIGADDHGNAPGAIFPRGGAHAELHEGGRRLQCRAAVADARDQAARGRTRRRPVSPRAAGAIDRAWPAHAAAAAAMLRGGKRCAIAGGFAEERRRRRAAHRADAFDRPVAAHSLSRPDQAPVQPAGIPFPARRQPAGRRISQERRGRARHRGRTRQRLGPARRLAAVHRRV